MRFLVIGYGNPLRTDDRFGLSVADRLKSRIDNNSTTSVYSCQQLLPEHVHMMKDCDWLIMVDASHQTPQGELRVRRVSGRTMQSGNPSHHMSPDDLIALAKSMECKPRHALLVTAGGFSFEAGETMTLGTSVLAEQVAQELTERISRLAMDGESASC